MMNGGIFPITESESVVLHELGWSSGYGWRDEWDWWRSDTPPNKQMESRDWDKTKLRLMEHVIAIRDAHKLADASLIDFIKRNQSN